MKAPPAKLETPDGEVVEIGGPSSRYRVLFFYDTDCAKYLKDFVDAAFQFHIVLHYRHKAISNYGTIDLDADCILRSAPELLDAQVLFDSFEE